MGYDGARPADDDYISAGPGAIRANQEALKTGAIVNAGSIKGKDVGNASGQVALSNGVKCENLNADKLDDKDASEFAGASHGHNVATPNDNGFMSNENFQKLAGIAAGAEVNQNSFASFIVRYGGSFYNLLASSKTDAVQLLDGANITITPDTVNKTVTISLTGTVPNAAYAAAAYEAIYLHQPGGGYYGPSSFALASHITHNGELDSHGNYPDGSKYGYKKFANGIIMQWIKEGVNPNSEKTINLPLAFPTTGFTVIAQCNATIYPFEQACVEFLSNSQIKLRNISSEYRWFSIFAIGN